MRMAVTFVVLMFSSNCFGQILEYKDLPGTETEASVGPVWQQRSWSYSSIGIDENNPAHLKGQILRMQSQIDRLEKEKALIMRAVAQKDDKWLSEWMTAVSIAISRKSPMYRPQRIQVSFQ